MADCRFIADCQQKGFQSPICNVQSAMIDVRLSRVFGPLSPVSCLLGFVLSAALPAHLAAQAPTYAEHVAPILDRHCAVCHRPGGVGPFNLLTYEDAQPRAAQLAAVTTRRYMPPWKPDPDVGSFVGVRRVSDQQIEWMQRWAAAGAPEGDRSARPAPPTWTEGWQLGEPDLVVRMKEPYTMAPDGLDVFRNFALSLPIDERRFIRAFELRPSNPRVIHHARILIDRTSTARTLDAEDAQPGYDGTLVDQARFPDGHFLGWAPGKTAAQTPVDLAWSLEPGWDLVLQLHMIPTGRREPVEAEIGLYYADAPPMRTPVLVLLGSKTIDIPPAAAAHVVEDRYRLPVDVDLLSIYPHAHHLARQVESFATLPDGPTRPLIKISDWDFNWQDEYRYVEPVRLPAGTTVVMRYTYDNSAGNIRNPHMPPQRVRFGPRSTDEMAELMLQVLATNPADRGTLVSDLSSKLLRDDVAGYTKMIEDNPGDHVSRTGLAVRYLELGQPHQAVPQLEEAVRLQPDFSPAHYNLGFALTALGRPDEAIAHYRRAIELKPDYPQAHNNLGGVLQAQGAVDEAVLHYRLALQFNPHHVEAHSNLGNVLQFRGQLDEAISHYRAALAAKPEDAATHNNLGWSLAAQGKRKEAISHYRQALAGNSDLVTPLSNLAWLLATAPEAELRNAAEALPLAERAAELTGRQHVVVLDTLAAAYAALGQFEKAIETAQAAVKLATAANQPQLAAQIRGRLQLYLQYKPFRLTPVEPRRQESGDRR